MGDMFVENRASKSAPPQPQEKDKRVVITITILLRLIPRIGLFRKKESRVLVMALPVHVVMMSF